MLELILQRLSEFEIARPGKLAMEITAGYAHSRSMCLSCLEIEDGKCAWCNNAPLPSTRHKYCTHHCRDSAFLFCYPQDPKAKAYLLMTQDWVCTICGLCYEDRAHEIIKSRVKDNMDVSDDQLLYWIGYRISREMDMDHILPIFRGGIGIGFRNHQVICRPCHHRKTASER